MQTEAKKNELLPGSCVQLRMKRIALRHYLMAVTLIWNDKAVFKQYE
jgi:hypothetical protein